MQSFGKTQTARSVVDFLRANRPRSLTRQATVARTNSSLKNRTMRMMYRLRRFARSVALAAISCMAVHVNGLLDIRRGRASMVTIAGGEAARRRDTR